MKIPVIEITVGQIGSRKKVLEAKLRELLGTSYEREEISIEYLADPLDQIRSNADRDMALLRLDHPGLPGSGSRAALTKMDERAYGLCEECEEPISQTRLNAIPWARICLSCQGRSEEVTHPAHPSLSNAA